MAETGLLRSVVGRVRVSGAVEAYSGATFERGELPDDRPVVLKHLPAGGDWLTRALGGHDRVRRLWESGVLHRTSAVIDHAVLDLCEEDGHDVLVMRDVGAELLPPDGRLSRATSQRIVVALAALHELGRREPPQPLCPLTARYTMLAPATAPADVGPNPNPGREIIAAGWQRFVDHAPADVAEVVFAVHRDPDLVARPLAAFEPTLLHGDAKPHNLGLGRDTVIAIDWGDLTGFGPPAAEIAWYAVCAAGRLPCSPDDVFIDYQDLSGAQIDPAEIDLALVGALAQLGFYLPPTELDWWCHRVRSALERRHF